MDEAEIVKSPSVRSSIKEPSIRSIKSPKEPSIRSQTISESRQSPVVKELSPIRTPVRTPIRSPVRSPVVSSPSPQLPALPSGSIQITNSKQGSYRSERSVKSPTPKQLPTEPKITSDIIEDDTAIANQNIDENINELTDTIKNLSKNLESPAQPPRMSGNIDKIADMSKKLTSEANALRDSIKNLSLDIARTKNEFCACKTDEEINFPYHLFLIEIIVNKIHMKCECFEIDYNNLVISATFLGKHPIVLYDPSYGKIENFSKLNVGKSTLFAMTYDKICAIKEFEIILQLTKQPPCSSCVSKIGETHMDYTKEFVNLREDLCSKWCQQQPKDNIQCTTSTPLSKNMYYLSCGDNDSHESIGVIEVTVRMSFLGKEITTAFCASPKPQAASFLLKEDNGMSMYSCHKVEMDDQGKVLLDEDVMTKRSSPRNVSSRNGHKAHAPRSESPVSQLSSLVSSKRSVDQCPLYYPSNPGSNSKYDEIFTKMNDNELKIRVPKSTKVERMGKYDKIQELCSCDSTPYNAGEQIQFELPRDRDLAYPDKGFNTHTSNLKYTFRGGENRRTYDSKDRKLVNVTPTNCPVPVDMEKVIHPQKDVFILKIGKKLETKDKKTDLEIELVTPKAPSEKAVEITNIAQQCSTVDLKKTDLEKKESKKGKGKKGKAGKGKKGGKKKK